MNAPCRRRCHRARGMSPAGFVRVRHTLAEARRFQDLFRFLVTLAVYYCGIYTVIVLAAVYAQQVMGFSTQETIALILVVNITAAAGAFLFGQFQDRLGSVRTLTLTLLVWIAALVLAYVTESRASFWVVANLVGFGARIEPVGRARARGPVLAAGTRRRVLRALGPGRQARGHRRAGQLRRDYLGLAWRPPAGTALDRRVLRRRIGIAADGQRVARARCRPYRHLRKLIKYDCLPQRREGAKKSAR